MLDFFIFFGLMEKSRRANVGFFVSIRFVDGRLLWFKMINASTVSSSCYCYVLCGGGTDFFRVGKSHQKIEHYNSSEKITSALPADAYLQCVHSVF